MIPYFQLTSIAIGPIHIQVWGLMVSFGIMAGLAVCYLLAQKRKLSFNYILDVAVWAIVGGLIGGRIFFALFYEPAYFIENPLSIFKIWQGGASSLGGFVGATIAIVLYLRIKKIQAQDFLPYADIMTVGFWLGWGIGRLGCFFIHDHVGKLNNSFMAVNFPAGSRLDMGLLESILGFVLFIVFLVLYNRLSLKKYGLVLICSFIFYVKTRFFLDFMRATDLPQVDIRYFYLTPAQWGMIILFVSLTVFSFWAKILPIKQSSSKV